MSCNYDLVVAGAGSGGTGAAIAASRRGVKTLLIESGDMVGGTSTIGGVNVWEMGVGGTGVPFDIYRKLKEIPNAVGIYSLGRHFCDPGAMGGWPHDMRGVSFPGGENVVDPAKNYLDTLRRHPSPECRANVWSGWAKRNWHGVPFEPEAFHQVAVEMLTATGNCEIRLSTAIKSVQVKDGRIRSAVLSDGSEVEADAWIDGTGNGVLCKMAGCEQLSGIDPRSRFDEPGAPEKASPQVNPPTLIFRVAKTSGPLVEKLPNGVLEKIWWREFPVSSCVNHYPNGDLNINMLPTMESDEFASMGAAKAYEECRRRVYCHWHFLQTGFPEFQHYRMARIFPMLGVRESYRTVCEKMLTENDIILSLRRQKDQDIVAIGDHALDRHGQGGGCPELEFPYGIPYRCLIPKGYRNLLIACRAAGFSSIAASSTRLSRTLMQLGQAAGNAVALAKGCGCELPDVSPHHLRNCLSEEHVQLEYPIGERLEAYLRSNQ